MTEEQVQVECRHIEVENPFTREKSQLTYAKYGDHFYTFPFRVGMNTNRHWEKVSKSECSDEDGVVTPRIDLTKPYGGRVDQNPHAMAGSDPQKFWITASNLIDFLSATVPHEDNKIHDLAKMLYDDAKKDHYYPDFQPTDPADQMNWYKFNRTYTENLTRAMGKGLSFCYNPSITDANSVKNVEDATTMISYAYNSDPSEMLEALTPAKCLKSFKN